MTKITSPQITAFQKEILDWYHQHQRDLPWRKDRNPYQILVSEVMLQQTQVQRVIPKYEAWLQAFPTLRSLASASIRDVLLYWSGLGYNRRALFLQKFAQEIVEKFAGQIPQDEKTLRTLPGIGEYTARALLCFAFNQQIAVVDTNVRKVILTRIMHYELSSKQKKDKNALVILHNASDMVSKPEITKEIQAIADKLLPHGRAYEWNQALMDYASVMLKEHKIPVPKQKKFHGSDRYYRGYIIKLLLTHRKMTFGGIYNAVSKMQWLERVRLKTILISLQKDQLISKQGKDFMLLQKEAEQ